MKTTVISPANIAFIKYWGNANEALRLPNNSSVSMCLSELHSTSTIEFDTKYQQDEIIFLDEEGVQEKETERIAQVLNRVRDRAGSQQYAKVVTQNNFPKGTGIASSASGLSALSMAASKALGLELDLIELSKLSRLASGSACRSLHDGFVLWHQGNNHDTSYAEQLYPPEYWDICDLVVIVDKNMKKVSSTKGHALAQSSPFYKKRIVDLPKKLDQLLKALRLKDFGSFGSLVEQEALNFQSVCLTSNPTILYWEPVDIEIMRAIWQWRESKEIESYFTFDAGPSVHVICKQVDSSTITSKLSAIPGVQKIVVNRPSYGARISNNHLF